MFKFTKTVRLYFVCTLNLFVKYEKIVVQKITAFLCVYTKYLQKYSHLTTQQFQYQL